MSEKKILIISYYWPPAGGPAVQRVVKYVKYLSEFNYQPIVLTVENPQVQAYDNSLLKEIPAEVEVIKTKSFQPFGIYKKLLGIDKNTSIPKQVISKSENESFKSKISRFIRANIFIPDARIGWFPYLVNKGLKICKEKNIDVIFSTSPPHSVHLGAKKIAKKTKIKWIADFRDPWVDAYWNLDMSKMAFAEKLDKIFEKNVLKSADTITTVSEELINLFQARQKNNYELLHNGFEKINLTKKTSAKFEILFIISDFSFF